MLPGGDKVLLIPKRASQEQPQNDNHTNPLLAAFAVSSSWL